MCCTKPSAGSLGQRQRVQGITDSSGSVQVDGTTGALLSAATGIPRITCATTASTETSSLDQSAALYAPANAGRDFVLMLFDGPMHRCVNRGQESAASRATRRQCRRTELRAPMPRNPLPSGAGQAKSVGGTRVLLRIAISTRSPEWRPVSIRSPPLQSSLTRHRPRNAQAHPAGRFAPCLAPATATEQLRRRRKPMLGNEGMS